MRKNSRFRRIIVQMMCFYNFPRTEYIQSFSTPKSMFNTLYSTPFKYVGLCPHAGKKRQRTIYQKRTKPTTDLFFAEKDLRNLPGKRGTTHINLVKELSVFRLSSK